MDTCEALAAVLTLNQRCVDTNVDIFICTIDYRKAFDYVKHDKLMKILKSIGIHRNDLRHNKSDDVLEPNG